MVQGVKESWWSFTPFEMTTNVPRTDSSLPGQFAKYQRGRGLRLVELEIRKDPMKPWDYSTLDEIKPGGALWIV